MAEYFVAVSTRESVEEAIQSVTERLQAHQFGVLWHLDINEKLEEKGVEPGLPFHILEVCSAPRAKQALTTNQRVGYFLPCKIVVYTDDQTHGTVIGLQRPRLMTELLGDPALEPLANEVELLLTTAIQEAVH